MSIRDRSYSLIIPTRNRQNTAIEAIRSAINCKYSSLEIIVADNSDDDSLREELTRDKILHKVIYIKSKKTLSMRDNWECGLDAATGEYITIIGDDDAILPDALLYANYIFHNHPDLEVLHNSAALYKWPDYPYPGRQNYLRVDYDSHFILFNNPRAVLRSALEHKLPIGTGPGLYYGFVRLEFLQKIKKLRGRWLVDPIPDLDSGYATLMYAKKYAWNTRPLFIEGHCGNSNSGAIRFEVKQKSKIQTFSEESDLNINDIYLKEVPNLHNMAAVIVSCQRRLLQEIRHVLSDSKIEINLKNAWDFISENSSEGYENISFLRARENLEQLATQWGVRKKISLPNNRKIAFGLVLEQGPKLKKNLDNKKSDSENNNASKALDAENKNFNRIICNGNRLGFTGILDAVRFLHATLPSIVSINDLQAKEYFLKYQNLEIELLIMEAKNNFKNNDLINSEYCIIKALREIPSNIEASQLLAEIYIKQNRLELACITLSGILSIKPKLNILKMYVSTCLKLGIADEVLDIFKRIENKNNTKEINLYINEIRNTIQN
jgi:glycosyltransferase involved in cell wall biosynthesis